jgi:RNA polymerase subunit RPABC4/transcription elongation factor Spt4
MIGKKCNYCGDKVLILKEWKGNKLCLDCLDKSESDEILNTNKLVKSENKEKKNMILKEDNRRCPNCKRLITEDARYCPYCSKKFW